MNVETGISPEQQMRDPNKVTIGLEDIRLRKGSILAPRVSSFIRVHINEQNMLADYTEDELDRLRLSGRSRYAQEGAVPSKLTAKNLVEIYRDQRELGNTSFDCILPFENLSDMPIEFKHGDGILRAYVVPEEPISNGELMDLVARGVIQMDGKQGSGEPGTPEFGEWDYYHEDGSNENKDIKGIAFRIKEDQRFFIPKKQGHLYVPSDVADFRKIVQSHWVNVSKRKNSYEPGLWFGKTIATNFEYPVVAEIDPKAYPQFSKNSPHGHDWEHIESRFLGSDDNWEIIVELYSPTEGDNVAKWVIFRFYRQQ